jgi:spore germination cell wall hydrolase CwlJ-like protein
MKSKLFRASPIAAAATMMATNLSAGGSGAAAETPQFDAETVAKFNASFDKALEAAPQLPTVSPTIAEAVVQPLPGEVADKAASQQDETAPVRIDADTLAELVATQSRGDSLTAEQNCLAGAIYFEAKSESLEGQLAVGRVIVARSKSGRFPTSYCGVVYQPSQFSFVRGHAMPGINKTSHQWQNAVALARIADAGSWQSPVEGALYFHAASVSPGWRMKRLARVDNHIFYR